MTNFHDNKDWNALSFLLIREGHNFMTNFHDNKDWNSKMMKFRQFWKKLYDQLPWQQGLKLICFYSLMTCCGIFMTNFHDNKDWNIDDRLFLVWNTNVFMTNFHDNKDWNIGGVDTHSKGFWLYDQLPWQQGLKRRDPCAAAFLVRTLWPTSMTTRIETTIPC